MPQSSLKRAGSIGGKGDAKVMLCAFDAKENFRAARPHGPAAAPYMYTTALSTPISKYVLARGMMQGCSHHKMLGTILQSQGFLASGRRVQRNTQSLH